MFALQAPSVRMWNVSFPTVCRYIDTPFLEAFFEKGQLRICPFLEYARIDDESRQDVSEGKANFRFTKPTFTIGGMKAVGKTSYMMCFSALESASLMLRFKCSNYIKITNILAFADVVGRHIPGFIGGHIGPCVYREIREINGATSRGFGVDEMHAMFADGVAPDEKTMEAQFEQQRLKMNADLQMELQYEHYFLKEEANAVQVEFRVVWNVPYETTQPIFVACPEAVALCTPGIETERTRSNTYKPPPQSDGVIAIVGTGK